MMLDDNMIKEANRNMERYTEDKFIKKEPFKQVVFDTFMRNHRESLALAEHIRSNRLSNLWNIVVSYYSMFYIANAVLYKLGYKIGDKAVHKVTSDALIVFVRKKLAASLFDDYELAREEALEIAGNRADDLLSEYEKERGKRSIFQYETTDEIKEAKANTSLERAKRFGTEMHKLLSDIKR